LSKVANLLTPPVFSALLGVTHRNFAKIFVFKKLRVPELLCSVICVILHTHTHTTVLLLFWNMSGTTRVSRYQKGKTRKVKTNLDLLEQETVSGSGIC